ncbi:MAG: PAS domain S-box protein, partial [Proteobacteria bacterium]|nr:PAS domain S-box protein [Pseudomonadota bacterium]
MSNVQAPTERRIFRVTTQVCGGISAAFGFAALGGWILKAQVFASLGSGWIPMAPSTALLFVLLGLALLFHARWPDSLAVHRAAIGAGLVTGTLALLLFMLSMAGIQADLEHFDLSLAGSVAGATIGHMSPVTAALFVLAATLLVVLLSSFRDRRAQWGFWLACLVIATSTFFLLAYLFGKPLLYGGNFIPPALTTSMAFMVLGISLMSVALPRAWQLDDEIDAESRRFGRLVILAFVSFASGLVALGFWYGKTEEGRYREQTGRELSAIADLKVQALVRWRQERLGDAAMFLRNGTFTDLVRRAFGNPPDRRAQEQLQVWLRQVREAYQYGHIFLSDAGGVARIWVPEQLPSGIIGHAATVERPDQVGFVDFHRDVTRGPIHLAVVASIGGETNAGEALGQLYLAVDPYRDLYSIVQSWPTQSSSADVVLVRREADHVLFLNEPRFEKNSALTLRIPLTNTDAPVVKAAMGQEGVVEGVDHRGVSVISSMRRVPDSPWFLVARIDAAEALAPVSEKLWLMTGLVGAMLLTAAGAAGFALRHRRVRYFRERFLEAEALNDSLARHRAVTEAANDAIITFDVEGRIVDWNPAADRIFGYPKTAVLGQSITRLISERDRDRYQAAMAKVVSRQEQHMPFTVLELQGLTQAGSEFPMEMSLSRWQSSEGTFVTCFARDITERREHEGDLRLFRAAMDATADGIYLVDRASLRFIDINEAACRMQERTREELLALGPEGVLAASRGELERMYDAVIASGTRTAPVERRRLRKDGSPIWLVLHRSAQRSAKGWMIVTVVHDITERKQADAGRAALEAQLRESQKMEALG